MLKELKELKVPFKYTIKCEGLATINNREVNTFHIKYYFPMFPSISADLLKVLRKELLSTELRRQDVVNSIKGYYKSDLGQELIKYEQYEDKKTKLNVDVTITQGTDFVRGFDYIVVVVTTNKFNLKSNGFYKILGEKLKHLNMYNHS